LYLNIKAKKLKLSEKRCKTIIINVKWDIE
jgi:hypothetical protein